MIPARAGGPRFDFYALATRSEVARCAVGEDAYVLSGNAGVKECLST
jgi:hypothetical protein